MAIGLDGHAAHCSAGHPALIALCCHPDRRGWRFGHAIGQPGVVLEGVPPEQAGTASAVFNTFRQVGGAVAIAVFGALIADPDHGRRRPADSASAIAAALLLLAALSSLRIQPRADMTT